MIRSVTTKLPNNLDVEMHVGIHTPHKVTEGAVEQSGDPFLVVEVWVKDEHGEARYKRATGMTMDDFLKLARDTAKVGKEILAAAGIEERDKKQSIVGDVD